MKKLSTVLALAAVCAVAAWGVDFTALQPQGYVSDFAGVVDASSRARLEQYCAVLEKSTGVQMALVTIPSLAGEPVDDVANALFRKWGIGQKGKNDGVLLLLSIQDRRSRLELGYGLEPDITDGMAGDTLRAMAPYLRAGRYGDAFLQAANDIGARISRARNVALDTPAPQPHQRRPRQRGIPFGVLVGGVILFFVLSSLMRGGRGPRPGGGAGGFLTGMLLGNMMGRGFGGYRGGGGGFGGFDSGGGGFGGFGGGDSGGGGASGSW
ncbi:MAG TPA: TPM domain-containing protein [Bryobacteraceae bacterium]|nr:TPM domain-containing protein [Bryobacteraceae bacterium]